MNSQYKSLLRNKLGQEQLKQHFGLLHAFSKKAFARIRTTRPEYEYEDVYQIMCLAFVKAQQKWNPDAGFSFTAYMGQCCWNEFNKIANRIELERGSLNIVSMEDFRGDDERADPLEWLPVQDGMTAASPEDLLQKKQHAKVTMGALSTNAQIIIKELAKPSKSIIEKFEEARAAKAAEGKLFPRDLTVRFVARQRGISEDGIVRVCKEFKRKLGVTV